MKKLFQATSIYFKKLHHYRLKPKQVNEDIVAGSLIRFYAGLCAVSVPERACRW